MRCGRCARRSQGTRQKLLWACPLPRSEISRRKELPMLHCYRLSSLPKPLPACEATRHWTLYTGFTTIRALLALTRMTRSVWLRTDAPLRRASSPTTAQTTPQTTDC